MNKLLDGRRKAPLTLTRFVALAAMALSSGLTWTPTVHAQDRSIAAPQPSFDARQTGDIEAIVRNYLLKNPEVLLEAMDALEAKRADEQLAAQKSAIEAAGASLVDSPEGTVLGNPDGDVTVVEFFDYNCGYCKHALADMDALVAGDPNLRFVLKEVAVLGPQSVEASRVSLAVREIAPGRYGEFHRRLLSARGAADETKALAVADEMGLATEDVRAAMQSEAVQAAFNRSNALAGSLAINGTPSYVIGDQVMAGAVGVDRLAAGISNMRRCGSATC